MTGVGSNPALATCEISQVLLGVYQVVFPGYSGFATVRQRNMPRMSARAYDIMERKNKRKKRQIHGANKSNHAFVNLTLVSLWTTKHANLVFVLICILNVPSHTEDCLRARIHIE